MQVGDIEYDHDRGLLSKDGVTVSVSTGKRRAIWYILACNANVVVDEDDIRKSIYGDRTMCEGIIRQHIYGLRRRIKMLRSGCKIVNWGLHTWELVT